MNSTAHGTDVIVIGAGLAGLTAASAVLEQGRSVVVLEASRQPGGRIKSLQDPESGEVLGDLGPTWVWPPYQPVAAQWLQRLELDTFAQFETGNAAIDYGPDTRVQFQPLPGQHGIARIAGGPAAMIERLVAGLPAGVLLTDCPVKAITTSGPGVVVEAQGRTFSADQVIVCVPLRVAAHGIAWAPSLPGDLMRAMQGTPTWMSVHAKALMVYSDPFWRKAGLSGRLASRSGPLVEAHDISGKTGTPAALFGFVGWPYDIRQKHGDELRAQILDQLVRCFGEQAGLPTHFHIEDWADNPFVCTPGDLGGPMDHPQVAPEIVRQLHSGGRVAFGVAETSDVSPGLIEGALAAGMRAAKLVSVHGA